MGSLVSKSLWHIGRIIRMVTYGPIPRDSGQKSSALNDTETSNWKIFMKDKAAMEEALRLGAEPYQGDYGSLTFK
jgi:hypothetical protein